MCVCVVFVGVECVWCVWCFSEVYVVFDYMIVMCVFVCECV